MRKSTFNKEPFVRYQADRPVCWAGWDAIVRRLQAVLPWRPASCVVLAVECYQGVFENDLLDALVEGLRPAITLRSQEAFKPEAQIRKQVQEDLTNDPVFGKMTSLTIEDYFDTDALAALRRRIRAQSEGLVLIVGPGAALLVAPDVLVYADMARWEIQQRMRQGAVSNLGVNNRDDALARQYKWGYFIDWRVLDRHKKRLFDQWDYVLDTNDPEQPKLVEAEAYWDALHQTVAQPFMLAPFFDPGPWGGQWMKAVCDLDPTAPNYAWCFNCVPEENSLLIQFNGCLMECPAINLVFRYPEALLGVGVVERFGAEFPIRFDFLDTIDGGNLSLQVHPTAAYIREQFGLAYTQDESYYLLDAKPGARVYLGLREGVSKQTMRAELERAQAGAAPFDAERFATSYPVEKHDHVSIPAGTVHCSGKDAMVLEISATPYIFTFKLWDWGRMGLDGTPRPIHIDHGMNVLDAERTEAWVRKHLLGPVVPVAEEAGWREEQTGLHASAFIETRRHWFTGTVRHHTRGTVHVLNLVEGEQITIESPRDAFAPFVVHYAETFIVPAQVGAFTIRPTGPSEGKECATIKAYVRETFTDNYE